MAVDLSLLLIFAIVSFVIGRRRYVGTEPHCRKCNYLLHGLESQRCPECGLVLTVRGIVHGEPRRRWACLITGWLLIAFAGGLLLVEQTPVVSKIDWYHYLPTRYVFHDLASGQLATAQRAWDELARRQASHALSPQQLDDLVTFSLARQGSVHGYRNSLDMDALNYLGDRAASGALTAAQTGQFCQQLLQISLKVRSKIVSGDTVPYFIVQKSNLPDHPRFSRKLVPLTVTIDGHATSFSMGSSSSGDVCDGWFGSSVAYKVAGPHHMDAICRLQIFAGSSGSGGAVLYNKDLNLSAPFQILPAMTRGVIQPFTDSKLIPAVTASIKPHDFSSSSGAYGTRLDGELDYTSLPTDIAFAVIARYGGAEYNLGSFICNAHSEGGDGIGDHVEAPVPATIDLILRPSRAAASTSMDLYTYWNHELVYRNVPVHRSP